MRKIYLLMSFALVSMFASAQETTPTDPVITLTVETVDDTEHTLGFGSSVADNKVSIDWGDGTIVEGATIGVYDGYSLNELTGKAVGTGVIKVYATGEFSHFDCVSRVDGTGYSALDVTKATGLTNLSANGNKLTTIDLSKNTKLTTVYLNNNSLTSYTIPTSVTFLNLQNNKLTSFDGSKCPNVVTLYLSNNSLKTLDLSGNLSIKSVYALNCDLESVNIGKNTTSKLYVSVNNNKLTTLDVTEATGLGTKSARLFAIGNNLTELKYTSITTANITGNKFTLATLPYKNITTLTYAPQQDMEIEAVDGVVDLSAQTNLTGLASAAKATTYAWYLEDGTALTAGADYTEADGKFTFLVSPSQPVYCTMTTDAFPKFTGANIFKTKAITVAVPTGIKGVEAVADNAASDVYNVAGQFVQKGTDGLKAGTYIVRKGGKAIKVIVK